MNMNIDSYVYEFHTYPTPIPRYLQYFFLPNFTIPF